MGSYSCLPDPVLEEFQLGKLPEEQLAYVAIHIQKCHVCQERIERFDNSADGFLTVLRSLATHAEPEQQVEFDMTEDSTGVLLALVQKEPFEGQVWDAFVQRYGPNILNWCQRWGLQEADAQDLTQDVFVKLLAKMRDFQYDRRSSFRAWLKTVVQHMIMDFLAKERRKRGSGDSAVVRLLNQVEARSDLAQRLEGAFDLELMAVAMQRVRERVEPHTWEAFRLTHLEQLPGNEAAVKLSMRVAHVFVAKRRVLKMLQEEIDQLENPLAVGG